MAYVRLIKLPLENILLQVLDTIPGKRFNKKKIIIGEEKVNVFSVRLQTFKKSIVCASCGIEGAYFWLERTHKDVKYHLNMYALDENNKEVLMTKDHIIPKSKGGGDNLKNMQTMCTKCNHKKGNKLEGDH